mmetsp:Transcript_724/g.941  ORF Transcript_724/g.941 Transcript_724/m.941 type:complete len:113 (-) Transcript_724:162-500(-)
MGVLILGSWWMYDAILAFLGGFTYFEPTREERSCVDSEQVTKCPHSSFARELLSIYDAFSASENVGIEYSFGDLLGLLLPSTDDLFSIPAFSEGLAVAWPLRKLEDELKLKL